MCAFERATAVTNTLANQPDIAKVQEWLGHANVFTTHLYERRKTTSSLLKNPSQILRGYDSLFLTEDRSCAEVLKIRDICFHT